MALSTHSGGAADKAGFFHESLWGVRCMVDVLNGEASAIRIETLGEDGAEFCLFKGNTREHWQAKRQVSDQQTWTLKRLQAEGILGYFFSKFRDRDTCVFASISDAPELGQLIENAKAAQKAGESIDRFKQHLLSERRSKHFEELQNAVGALSENEAHEFLCSVSVHGGREITLEPEFGFRLERVINFCRTKNSA